MSGAASAFGSAGRHSPHQRSQPVLVPPRHSVTASLLMCIPRPLASALLQDRDCVYLLMGQAAVTEPSFAAPLLNTYCVLGPGVVTGTWKQMANGLSQTPARAQLDL